jgi:hypothetical protein
MSKKLLLLVLAAPLLAVGGNVAMVKDSTTGVCPQYVVFTNAHAADSSPLESQAGAQAKADSAAAEAESYADLQDSAALDSANAYADARADTARDEALADVANTLLGYYTSSQVDAMVSGMATLDSLNAIDSRVSETEAALALKADASALAAHTGSASNPHSVTKTQVGLGNADNTSDADKPVSTAAQTALAGKASALTASATVYLGLDGKPSVALSAAAAVDLGGGLVGVPVTSHSFAAGDTIRLDGTANYGGADYVLDASTTSAQLVIPATYAAETFAATMFALYKQSAWTAAVIQALVDAQPRFLNGYTLTFQFRDGWYDLEAQLSFIGFSAGVLNINGDSADGSLATGKRVVLNNTSARYGLYIKTAAVVNITYLRVINNEVVDAGPCCAFVSSSSGLVRFLQCSFAQLDSGASCGVSTIQSVNVQVVHSYFAGGTNGIRFETSGGGLVYNCASLAADKPTYGLLADRTPVLLSGTDLTGTTAATSGSLITDITP